MEVERFPLVGTTFIQCGRKQMDHNLFAVIVIIINY